MLGSQGLDQIALSQSLWRRVAPRAEHTWTRRLDLQYSRAIRHQELGTVRYGGPIRKIEDEVEE